MYRHPCRCRPPILSLWFPWWYWEMSSSPLSGRNGNWWEIQGEDGQFTITALSLMVGSDLKKNEDFISFFLKLLQPMFYINKRSNDIAIYLEEWVNYHISLFLCLLFALFYIVAPRSWTLTPPSQWHHKCHERWQTMAGWGAKCSLWCLSAKTYFWLY